MILRNWKFWVILVVGATCVGLLEGAQVYISRMATRDPWSWGLALASTMPSWYVLAALLPVIVVLSRRFPLGQRQWRVSLAIHAVAGVMFALLHIAGATWLSTQLMGFAGAVSFVETLSAQLGLYLVVDLVTYFALVGGYHAYDYARRYSERERAAAQLALKASRLEANLALANLDSLRMQLNPHFLFNTMNAISVLARKGERQEVVRMLTLLSELLRQSLDQQNQIVPLREELTFLDRYLEIEQVRFKDRLTIEHDIEPEALDAEVPSLLLQPLVENAIKHGISRQTGPGTVRIEAHIVRGDTLELRVLDTGPGFSAATAPQPRTGLGTANTRARLEQLYGSDYSMESCNRKEGGACVTVGLPLRLALGDLLAEPVRSASA